MTAVTQSRPPRALNPRVDPWAPWLHIDLVLVAATAALTSIGLMMIYSATRGTDPALYDTSLVQKQAMFVVVGAFAMVVTAMLSTHALRWWAPIAYAGGLGLLALVLTPLGTGGVEKGAQAWFQLPGFQLQPSEPTKIALIVVLAAYLGRYDGDLGGRELAWTLAIAVVPMGLILLEPDVGTALVYTSVTAAMVLVGGIRGRHIAMLGALAGIGVLFIWKTGRLAGYQVERLTSFIDPGEVQTDAAYQQAQAQIAIGSGGLRGQGFGNGVQTRGDFVPEQHTDFIFTVVGEELGFIGAVTVLGLYALIVWRCWRTAKKAADLTGSLICIGVMTMIVFQMFQSVGMTLGIMPITGIPVPFLSYGGSSAITSFVGVGLVLNVHMRRHEVIRR